MKSEEKNTGNENRVSLRKLDEMTKAGKHPVLKGIKRQLIFESICWAVFLVVYYDFFDGHLKSLFWNAVLVLSVLLLFIHNMLGYNIVRTPVNGDTLRESLKNYLRRIKKYATISIATRVIAITSIVLFLTSNVIWQSNKFVYFGPLLIILIIQILMLNRVWRKRIERIRESYQGF